MGTFWKTCALLLTLVQLAGSTKDCSSSQSVCSCKIGHKTFDLSPDYTTHEILIGAIGAMSSIVLIGGGTATYCLIKKFCKGHKLQGDDFRMKKSAHFPRRNHRTSPPPSYGETGRFDKHYHEARTHSRRYSNGSLY